ncbi:MAG: ABC transporter permease [Deltaproteobacteria bacterium]|nr:ABC transporter permease [Deltaproteobacteria bacterium]
MTADLIALLTTTIALATPLLLAALGELIGERAGILNIGVEGLMLTGAFAGMLGSYATGSPTLGMLAACATALLLGVLFALWVVTLDVDQVVAGVAINLLAVGTTGVLYRAFFGNTGSALTVAAFAPLAIAPGVALLAPLRQPAPVYAALALVPLVWVFLFRTRLGLRLRAAGEAPHAAESVGVNVVAMRFGAVLAGALLAGAAGGYLSLAYSNTFVEGMSAGRGFIALAIVVFGRWQPLGVLAGSLLFGAASAAQFQLQAAGVAVPYHLLLMLPYVLTLVVLAIASRAARGPAALAQRRSLCATAD